MQFDPALYDLLTDAEKAEIDTLLLADIKEACEKPHGGLREFIKFLWPIVEPATPLVWGWTMDAIVEHLEAVTSGEIKRLIMNVCPGFSKALDKDTPILTTWGWKAHGDLMPGDFVFGPDGQPKRVLACTNDRTEECYEIKFDDDASVVASGGHLWAVERDHGNQPKRVRIPTVVTTNELIPSLFKNKKNAPRPDSIPLSEPPNFPQKRLMIDPYVLGAWLGDGAPNGGYIYAVDQDVYILKELGRIQRSFQPGAGRKKVFHRIMIDGLHFKLKALNLLKNKHIPADYMEASISQRWELLRGLMDTDGSCSMAGHPSFVNKNPVLAYQVRDLVCSLGMKAHIKSRYTMLNGTKYGPHFQITFTPPSGAIIFKLSRKQERVQGNKNPRSRRRYVTAINPVGTRVVKCIQVEGSIYLAGKNLVPTHNSLILNVFFPAWEWGPMRRPTERYISASYSQSLTMRDNLRLRRVLLSDRYKNFWGTVFAPSEDQFSATMVANDKTGWKLATSVGGQGTGVRGSRILIDDANNVAESESDLVLQSTNMWLTEVMPDRLGNQSTGAIINIQQRTAEKDATGTLLSLDVDYVHLMIPMLYDPDRHCTTPIGWFDPRTELDELAWPERFPQDVCDELKKTKGSFAWEGQYQQAPSPRGGGIIKEKDWQLWPPAGQETEWTQDGVLQFPPMDFILASFDGAYTEKKENDYSALVVLGVFRDLAGYPKVMLMNYWQDRVSLNDSLNKVASLCQRYKVDKFLVEAKATGISVSQEIKRVFGSMPWSTELIQPKGDKVARAYAIQHLFEEKIIYAPDRVWAQTLIDICSKFPKGRFKDGVDALTQGLKWLRMSGWALRHGEQDASKADIGSYASIKAENEPLPYDV